MCNARVQYKFLVLVCAFFSANLFRGDIFYLCYLLRGLRSDCKFIEQMLLLSRFESRLKAA